MATFKFNNKNVYYEVSGSGEPLLLLNGIMMSTTSWHPFIDTFKNYQLIRVDFLDQGKSDSLEEGYDQSIQVELLYALLNHLNIKKVNVVGISYGGEVALLFTIKYQEYVNKLIVFNSVAYTTEVLKKIGYEWNKYAVLRDTEKYYEVTIPIIYSNTFKETNKEWMEERKKLLCSKAFKNEIFLDRMVRLTNSAEKFDVKNKLKDLTIPVLIVAAEEDMLTPPNQQRLIANLIENSKLVIMANVGHASMYEDPHLFAGLIIGFIEVDSNLNVL